MNTGKEIMRNMHEGDLDMGNTKKLMDMMQKGFDRLDKRMDMMQKGFDRLDKRMDKMDKRMNKMDKRMDTIDKRLVNLEHTTKDIQLTIENEIRPNIQTIAEGHLDLNRKLDEALKVENEKEIMKIHLTYLENEVRRIKEKQGEPA